MFCGSATQLQVGGNSIADRNDYAEDIRYVEHKLAQVGLRMLLYNPIYITVEWRAVIPCHKLCLSSIGYTPSRQQGLTPWGREAKVCDHGSSEPCVGRWGYTAKCSNCPLAMWAVTTFRFCRTYESAPPPPKCVFFSVIYHYGCRISGIVSFFSCYINCNRVQSHCTATLQAMLSKRREKSRAKQPFGKLNIDKSRRNRVLIWSSCRLISRGVKVSPYHLLASNGS